jgi:hypothetical protein
MWLENTVGPRTPRGDGAPTGATDVTVPESGGTDWAAWSAAWGGVVVTAFVNGALHRAYATAVGEPTATRLSEVVLPLLLAPWVVRVDHRHRVSCVSDGMVVGVGWAAATVAFEFLFGHYVNGDSWQTLRAAYDLMQGRLWTVDVLLIAAAPAVARGWRLRRSRTDRTREMLRP